MKKILFIVLCVLVSVSTPNLYSDNTQFTSNDSHKDEYSWKLTDENQKKQAVGMYAWGFFFTIAIAIIANLAPNSPSLTPTSNANTSSSSSSSSSGTSS